MIRDRIRHTHSADGAHTAVWQLAPTSAAWILRLEDQNGAVTESFPDATDLAAAREQLPEHAALWDSVRSERLAAVLDTRELPASTDRP